MFITSENGLRFVAAVVVVVLVVDAFEELLDKTELFDAVRVIARVFKFGVVGVVLAVVAVDALGELFIFCFVCCKFEEDFVDKVGTIPGIVEDFTFLW